MYVAWFSGRFGFFAKGGVMRALYASFPVDSPTCRFRTHTRFVLVLGRRGKQIRGVVSGHTRASR